MKTKTMTMADRLLTKLMKFGLSKRKAQFVAKRLVPVVRAAIKAEAKRQSEPPRVRETIPAVQGVRLDLPVVSVEGAKGLDLLRVMNGLSSTASYLVAAVKSDQGILAVRQYNPDYYNVKFYPTLAYWDTDRKGLEELGATDYISRDIYQRMHFTREALDQLMEIVAQEAKAHSRMKALVDRLLGVSITALVVAFKHLHKQAA